MGKIVLAKSAAIVAALLVLGTIAITVSDDDSTIAATPTSPDELLSELASMGIRAEYSDQYSGPEVPSGMGGQAVLMSGGLQYENLELSVDLFSEGFLAEFHCQPRSETCVAFHGWVIRPQSPNGLTEAQFSVWRSIRQKLQ